MRETHYLEGEKEPLILCYAVLKSPELNNPLDPSSGETGNTLYGITEIYRGPEGGAAHMELGQQCNRDPYLIRISLPCGGFFFSINGINPNSL